MTAHHEDFVDAQGAYLLGALPQPEQERFEAHLVTCASCRADVDALLVVADALPSAAPPVEPSIELKDRIMQVVRSEAELLAAAGPQADVVATPPRRRSRSGWLRTLTSRPALAGGMAALALVAGAFAGFALRGGGDQEARRLQASVEQGSAPGGAGTLVLDDGDATLRLARMPQPPRGRVWQVWIKRPRRAPEPTDALFDVRRNGSATVAVPGELEGAEAVLVTSEPEGGSQVPTRQPAVEVSLT
ncbi:MAG: anti-sigma factor domain-containing protein [Solirubrobacteraceae bacterium]